MLASACERPHAPHPKYGTYILICDVRLPILSLLPAQQQQQQKNEKLEKKNNDIRKILAPHTIKKCLETLKEL